MTEQYFVFSVTGKDEKRQIRVPVEGDYENTNMIVVENLLNELNIEEDAIVALITKDTKWENIIPALNSVLVKYHYDIVKVGLITKNVDVLFDCTPHILNEVSYTETTTNINKENITNKSEIKDYDKYKDLKYFYTPDEGTSLLVWTNNRIFLARRDKKFPNRSSNSRICVSDLQRDAFLKDCPYGCTYLSAGDVLYAMWANVLAKEIIRQKQYSIEKGLV